MEIIMKLFRILILMLATCVIAEEIDLGESVFYQDFMADFSKEQTWKNEVVDYSKGSTIQDRREPALFMQSNDKDGNAYVTYKFFREDASKTGVIEVSVTELISGNGSWINFYYGPNEKAMAQNNTNATQIIGCTPFESVLRFEIPQGQKVWYFKIMHRGYAPGSYALLNSIKAAADIELLSAGNVITIPCSSSPFVQDFLTRTVDYTKKNYTASGFLQQTYQKGLLVGRSEDAQISYRFKGTEEQIKNAYVLFTGKDETSPDGSWFIIIINDSQGKQLYSNNLTNLAGGKERGNGTHTFIVQLKDVKGIEDNNEIIVKFLSNGQAANNDVALQYLEVGYELVGDINLDCKVDEKDAAALAGNWLGI
jgi:hypothetical protein